MTSAPSSPSSNCSPRQPRVDLRRGEGDVQEKADRAGLRDAEEARHEHQVVVVHPAKAAPAHLHRGEALVYLAVRLPPAALEDGLFDQPVQQRPERSVGEAVVEVLDLAPAQRNREELNIESLDAVRNVVGTAVPANPCTIA